MNEYLISDRDDMNFLLKKWDKDDIFFLDKNKKDNG